MEGSLMHPQRKRPGGNRASNRSSVSMLASPTSSSYYTPKQAPVKAFERELWIILNAAHRMAAGYGLTWSDYDRLHLAHGHVLRVLEVLADE